MANSPQARKRVRQADQHRTHNASMRSSMRTAVKKVANVITTGERAQAETAYKTAVPLVDRMARKGIIHKNKAARQKSRLNRKIRALQG